MPQQPLENLNISAFKKPINYHLVNNLPRQVCSTLANILALDYEIRDSIKSPVNIHANDCIDKLKRFLGHRIVLDDSFSSCLTLFSIAIAPEEVNYQDMNNQKVQEMTTQSIINLYFGEKSAAEKKQIKLILQDLQDSSGQDVQNYIHSEPKLIQLIVNNGLRKYQKQEEINNHVKTELGSLMNRTINLGNKINIFKQATAKIVTASAALGLIAATIAVAGPLLPAIIVPATIIALKYAPRLGEKLGQIMLDNDKNIKFEYKTLKNFKQELVIRSQQLLQSFPKLSPRNQQPSQKLGKVQEQEIKVIKEQLVRYKANSKATNLKIKTNKIAPLSK